MTGSPLDGCVCGHERHAHCDACMDCDCNKFRADGIYKGEPMSAPRNRPAITVYDFAKGASWFALCAFVVSLVNLALLVILLVR